MNNISLLGRLTADPELKTTQSGLSVTSFTLAVNRSYVKQGEERQADFIDIVAWRNTAEFICKYFKKGQMMAVNGSIQTRTYQDKNGNNRKAVEVVASNVYFGGDKGPNKGENNGIDVNPNLDQMSQSDDDFTVIDDFEDLPFI